MSAQPGNVTPFIREMVAADVEAVSKIEEAAYNYPWSRGIFRDCLMAGYECAVLDSGVEVIGYSIVSVAAAEGHILNLCVDRQYQGLGYGRHMLNHILDHAYAVRMQRLFLEVRPTNVAAIHLYREAGFQQLGVRKAYYKAAEGREDALVFVREFI